MALSPLNDHPTQVPVGIAEFPPCAFDAKTDASLQIAEHLKQVLGAHETGLSTFLRLPSAMTLSQFYKHSILEVLEGLYELKKQHYDYRLSGLDGNILLEDPLCRKTPKKLVQLFWNEVLHPGHLFHKAAGG